MGYYNLGDSYYDGTGVERNEKKGQHFFELAAMAGGVAARHNVGCVEGNAGNLHRAHKHFILAARAGDKGSLEFVKKGSLDGYVTKEKYADTLLMIYYMVIFYMERRVRLYLKTEATM